MSKDPRRLRALPWNLFAQGTSVLMSVALIKISVTGFSVSAYGIASLLLGLQALARGAGGYVGGREPLYTLH